MDKTENQKIKDYEKAVLAVLLPILILGMIGFYVVFFTDDPILTQKVTYILLGAVMYLVLLFWVAFVIS